MIFGFKAKAKFRKLQKADKKLEEQNEILNGDKDFHDARDRLFGDAVALTNFAKMFEELVTEYLNHKDYVKHENISRLKRMHCMLVTGDGEIATVLASLRKVLGDLRLDGECRMGYHGKVYDGPYDLDKLKK